MFSSTITIAATITATAVTITIFQVYYYYYTTILLYYYTPTTTTILLKNMKLKHCPYCRHGAQACVQIALVMQPVDMNI